MTLFWCEVPRDVIQVSGPDALTYLHSQVSNDLRPLQVGQSCWSLLLQPTGKVDVLVRVTRTADETFVLDTDAEFGEVMVARVNRFKIRVKADVEQLDWRCVAIRSSDGASVSDVAPQPGAHLVVGWGGGVDLIGPGCDAPAGVESGSDAQLLAARVEAAWPAMGSEITPGETVPAETGIASVAVSFTKGCYPGQELVERMDSRGATAPRLLQVVDVAAGTEPGAPLLRDGAEIGTVTSVAGTRALAYVKRSALAG
jgi:tRNA-modifying protein YgfZ